MIDIKSVLSERQHLTTYLTKKFRNIRPDDIDDIVQVSLIKACKNLADLQEKCSTRAWLSRIAVNGAIDFLRRSKTRPSTSLSELVTNDVNIDNVIDFYNNHDPIETIASNFTSNQILHEKLSILRNNNPIFYKTLMVYIDLGNYKEVQEAENVSIGTVKSRINRARKILLESFSDEELALISV
jgi:RNA polymerase sigma-70 factor (ECF subfamily)